MSGANAVSGITIVGALIIAGSGLGWISNVLGFVAVVLAMMNVAGGYAVTDRMLGMFRAKGRGEALMPHWLTQILYLISAVLFIIGLKRLGSPGNGAAGNLISLVGHAARDSRDACRSRDRLVLGHPRRRRRGHRAGTVAGLRREDDRDAADGGAAQRVRRRRVDGRERGASSCARTRPTRSSRRRPGVVMQAQLARRRA